MALGQYFSNSHEHLQAWWAANRDSDDEDDQDHDPDPEPVVVAQPAVAEHKAEIKVADDFYPQNGMNDNADVNVASSDDDDDDDESSEDGGPYEVSDSDADK